MVGSVIALSFVVRHVLGRDDLPLGLRLDVGFAGHGRVEMPRWREHRMSSSRTALETAKTEASPVG